ncbi:MAG: flagellar hook-associated protein FlgK [Steroidobacteraceae bacterium]
MSDVFGISISALQAYQTALQVTSNNIANANTPGYDKETVELTNAIPQSAGSAPIGAGVNVAGISRAYSELSANQLNISQSNLGQLNSLQSYTSQIDNIVGTTAGGLSTAIQNYYSAWSTLSNDPTSTASRQALLSAAQSVAAAFSSTNGQMQSLSSNINGAISADVTQINSLGSSIAALNQQVAVATANGGGQPPNDLIDQRDQLVSNLSKLVGISTTAGTSGAVNIFTGNGQPLVLGDVAGALTTVPNQFNATQLEVASANNPTNPISSQITSGDLGGLLAARTQAVDPAINQLGQIATALSQTANAQQNSGLDLNGQLGANIFSVGGPQAASSASNTDGTFATVSTTNVGALTTNDYLLRYQGGAYSLTNASDGSAVAFTGSGTLASPISAAGLSIVLSGTPASGDQFLIKPTAQAAGTFGVALTSTSQLAAAGAIQTSAAGSNAGNATISSGTVVTASNPALLNPVNIHFTSPTTYTINGGASQAYTPGANISQNGWQVQISGTPVTGDSFTVQSNAGGKGDNRNALASANQQTQGVLLNGTVSVNGAVGALITGVGSQAQQVNTAQAAQTAVNSSALQNVQSVSGVNLDEEAAHLLQWQQAYQASAQALSIANSTFTFFMDSINGTYS